MDKGYTAWHAVTGCGAVFTTGREDNLKLISPVATPDLAHLARY